MDRAGKVGRRTAVWLIVMVLVAGGIAVWKVTEIRPAIRVQVLLPQIVQPVSAVLPWAESGESAVSIPALGYSATSGIEMAVPTASTTKLMTAYLVLRDHPLVGQSEGPVITLGPADVETYKEDVATSQSNVEVISGERISEAAALEGMIVHSANNLATSLAVWDRGSLGAFVTEMNASAGALGMKRTHYVDASGYEAGSVSSAADLLMIAAADMGDAVFAQMAAMPEANLPVVGVVANVTPLAGTDGVIGVKSGYTSAAGGCDVLAIDPVLGGKPVLILAAVTGQRGPQPGEQAGEAALALSQGVAKTVQAVEWRAGTRVGVVRDGPARVSLVTTGRVSWLVENSDRASAKLVMPKSLIHGEGPGMVGKVTLRSGGREISVAVRLSAVVP